MNLPEKCSIYIDETNVINKREEDVMSETDKKDETDTHTKM